MPRRNRDKTGKFLPNTPTTSLSQPSLFSGDSEPEDPIGEPPEIYEDPIAEEELGNIPSEAMDENRNGRREDKTYDYAEDEQKLKLFPSTLKDAALRWFMGLLGNSVTTWA